MSEVAGHIKTKEVLVPQLRFPEFEEVWKSQKLGQLISLISGYAFKSEYFGENGEKLLTPKNFTKNGNANFTSENTKYTTEECDDKFICHPEDLLALLTDLTPSCELLGRPVILKERALLNQRIVRIEPKNGLTSKEFLSNIMQTHAYHKWIRSTATGTTVRHSSNDILRKFTLALPSFPEQQKIATFLSAVDKKIQQLQRKKELLEQYKKGVMQKIFSQEIRFKDANGNDFPDWEEKTFGEAATFINGRAYKQKELLDSGKYAVLRVGNLFSNNEWYYSDLELEEDKYVEDGDLMYAWSASFGPYFWHGTKTVYHYHIWKVIPSDITDKEFLYHAFSFDKEKIAAQSQGGTMFHITKGNMESRKFKFPIKEEQICIVSFLKPTFSKLDQIESELTQTQTFKKGLLQQMFV